MQNPDAERIKKISRDVARWIKGQGWSQKQVAEMLGMSRGAVSNQLSYLPFTKKTVAHWSRALGLNERFLLTGEGVISDRQNGYGRVVRENESLRTIVKSQEYTLNTVRAELERYRELYGPLPQPVTSIEPVFAMQQRV